MQYRTNLIQTTVVQHSAAQTTEWILPAGGRQTEHARGRAVRTQNKTQQYDATAKQSMHLAVQTLALHANTTHAVYHRLR